MHFVSIPTYYCSGLVCASAQEVPSSPHRADLPVEETSLTLHGRTPLKHRQHHSYTVEGGGHWVTGGDEQNSLFPQDEDEEREQSREEELELQRQFGMGPEIELQNLGTRVFCGATLNRMQQYIHSL